jgi:hypothetical protein
MITSFKITKDWLARIKNLLTGTETVSLFCYRAMEEKVKRMESRQERATRQIYERDIETLTPIIEAVLKRLGK